MTLIIFSILFLTVIETGLGQRNNVCKKDYGLYPHENYCDYYYECVDGEAILRQCPNGLAFSGRGRGLINNCDYAHRAGCPDEDGRVMGQSPAGSGNCPWLFGIFPHQKSCTRYWHCWNGTGTAQMCPFSLLYNEVEHACDWPENVPECQQHPLCQGNRNGLKPIDGSCIRYWQCVGGYPRLQRCPAGLAFSAEEMRCDWADNVSGCEINPVSNRVTTVSRTQTARRGEGKDDEKNENTTK